MQPLIPPHRGGHGQFSRSHCQLANEMPLFTFFSPFFCAPLLEAVEQLLPPGRGLPHPGVPAAGELLQRQENQDLPQVRAGTSIQAAGHVCPHVFWGFQLRENRLPGFRCF